MSTLAQKAHTSPIILRVNTHTHPIASSHSCTMTTLLSRSTQPCRASHGKSSRVMADGRMLGFLIKHCATTGTSIVHTMTCVCWGGGGEETTTEKTKKP